MNHHPPSTPAGEHSRSDPASAGARATARWRRRRARGSLIVPVELFNDEVQVLIRLGLLPSGDASHRRLIGRAAADLVERVLERTARSRRQA